MVSQWYQGGWFRSTIRRIREPVPGAETRPSASTSATARLTPVALPPPIGQSAPIRRESRTRLVHLVAVSTDYPTRLLVERDQPVSPPAPAIHPFPGTTVGCGSLVVLGTLVVGAFAVVGSAVAAVPRSCTPSSPAEPRRVPLVSISSSFVVLLKESPSSLAFILSASHQVIPTAEAHLPPLTRDGVRPGTASSLDVLA